MNPSSSRPRGQGTLDAWLGGSSRQAPAPASRQPPASASDQPRPPRTESNRNAGAGSQNSQAKSSQASSSGGGSYRNRDNGSTPSQRIELAAIAKETRTVLPDILSEIPHIHASKSEALFLSTLPPLRAADCPRYRNGSKATIRVINQDTFNAAIDLATHSADIAMSDDNDDDDADSGRVAVLNMASHSHPGGGWLKGAMAQEEAMCYRSSLALSLHRRYYPWKQRMGIYTPDVVVIRSDVPSGHTLLVPDVAPADLPVVSVLSIAAPRCPEVRRIRQTINAGAAVVERTVYADPAVRDLLKDKMRLCLRMAAQRGHKLLVLGALGCGAFRNPRREVAHCWLEVFREAEFQGGWWEEVWFAVYDRKNEGNFEVFEEILGGVDV